MNLTILLSKLLRKNYLIRKVTETGENYTLIIEDNVVVFQIDLGESVDTLDSFLNAMRKLMKISNQQAQKMWKRAE
jgi:hypothetical protein